MRSRVFSIHVLAVCMAGAGVPTSRADLSTGSWYLNQSNTFADGVNYAKVTIDADSSLGTVKFTVDAFDVPSYGTLSNFGIQKFGFNYDNVTLPRSSWLVSLPAGWEQAGETNLGGGFGSFEVAETGTGRWTKDSVRRFRYEAVQGHRNTRDIRHRRCLRMGTHPQLREGPSVAVGDT